MSITDSLRILITCNGAQAEREFQKVGAAARTNLGHAESSAQQFGRTLTSAGVAMVAFGGVALVGLYKAAQAAQEEDLAITKLNTAFQNSPVLVGQSTDALLEQAAALQDTTVYSDDATIGMQALLSTFRLTSDEIQNLTPLVQDLASFWGIDLETAAKQVGKAMQGNIGALQRSGVQIDEAAFATDRYSAVMSALRENAGGFAEEEGKTFNGQITIMKNNLEDIAEGIGRGAVQAFNSLLGPVKSVSDAFQGLSPEVQASVGKVATFGATGLVAAGSISFLAGQVINAATRFGKLKAAMTGANLAALAAYGPWAALAAILVGIQTGALDWTSALSGDELDSDAVDAMTAAMTEAGSAAEGLRNHLSDTSEFDPSFFDELGVSTDEFATALLGGEAAWDSFVGRVTEGLPEGWTDALELHRERALASADAFRVQGGAAQELAQATEDAAESADLLEQRWSDLNSTLSAFDAVTAAQQAVLDLRTSFQEATAEGGITQEEMLGLRGNLSGLVGSYQELARAQNTNAEGVVNVRGANQQLRGDLATLAAFIPAQLLPQWQALTRDIRAVPNHVNVQVSSNVEFVRREFELLVGAINNAGAVAAGHSADFHGGAPGESGGRSGGGNSPAAEIGRAVARELARQPLMTVAVG